MRKCLNCSEVIEGRSDKKYCSSYCKSTYHNVQNQNKPDRIFTRIDKQLKLNRIILKSFNKGGKSIVRKSKLVKEGFDPNFFTHYWKNQKGAVYLFCYEFGFLHKREKEIDKYVLVDWQDYMSQD